MAQTGTANTDVTADEGHINDFAFTIFNLGVSVARHRPQGIRLDHIRHHRFRAGE